MELHKKAYRLVVEPSKVMRGYEEITEKTINGLLTVGQETLENTAEGRSGGCGHVSLVGNPGVGKTMLAETLQAILDCKPNRIQYTADMLPSDVTGARVYNPVTTDFEIKKGPIFGNIVLADEINRAPGKVQSAQLSAMAESKVIISDEVFRLDDPFFVITTENPIEQEGTYKLTEAQLDRLIFRFLIEYIPEDEELKLVKQHLSGTKLEKVANSKDLVEIRKFIRDNNIYICDEVDRYVVSLVRETRPQLAGDDTRIKGRMVKDLIDVGSSPRGAIFLRNASQTNAFLHGRDYVIMADVDYLKHDILSHRIILSEDGDRFFNREYRLDTAKYREEYKAKKILIDAISDSIKMREALKILYND